MKRSPRDGWRLVELVDGRWQTTLTGDREAVLAAHVAYMRVTWDMAHPQLRYPGRAAIAFDAVGQARDEHPALPRLVDGTRIEWPASPPGPEGADVAVRATTQRAEASG